MGWAEGLSEEERKKALSKLRKAEAKAKATTVEKVDNSKAKKETKDPKKVDADPEGALLAKTDDPLGEAIKFLGPLLQFHAGKIETHQLAGEVYLRKSQFFISSLLKPSDSFLICIFIFPVSDKPLMVLKSLKKAKTLDAADSKMHVIAVKFLLSLPSLTLHSVVDAVLKEEVAELFSGKDAAALNSAFVEQHSKSLPHLIAGIFQIR